MTESAKSSEVTDAEARRGVLAIACVLSLIAVWNFYRGRMIVALVFISTACALVLMPLLFPAQARRFHIAWMRIAGALGRVNNHILLAIVFYLLFVPYNLAMRLMRRDPLGRRKVGRESYWTRRQTTRQSKEQFERLF